MNLKSVTVWCFELLHTCLSSTVYKQGSIYWYGKENTISKFGFIWFKTKAARIWFKKRMVEQFATELFPDESFNVGYLRKVHDAFDDSFL